MSTSHTNLIQNRWGVRVNSLWIHCSQFMAENISEIPSISKNWLNGILSLLPQWKNSTQNWKKLLEKVLAEFSLKTERLLRRKNHLKDLGRNNLKKIFQNEKILVFGISKRIKISWIKAGWKSYLRSAAPTPHKVNVGNLKKFKIYFYLERPLKLISYF